MEALEVMALIKEGKLKTWQHKVIKKYMKELIGTTVISKDKEVAKNALQIEVIQ